MYSPLMKSIETMTWSHPLRFISPMTSRRLHSLPLPAAAPPRRRHGPLSVPCQSRRAPSDVSIVHRPATFKGPRFALHKPARSEGAAAHERMCPHARRHAFDSVSRSSTCSNAPLQSHMINGGLDRLSTRREQQAAIAHKPVELKGSAAPRRGRQVQWPRPCPQCGR